MSASDREMTSSFNIQRDKDIGTSLLISEIDLLLMMRHLNSLDDIPAPINRGMAVLMSLLFERLLPEKQAYLKMNYVCFTMDHDYFWLTTMRRVARHIDMYDVFFRPDSLKFLENNIRFIMSDYEENEALEVSYLSQPSVAPDRAIPFMQRRMLSLVGSRTGYCMHYAPYAMYQLLQAGVRPVGSILLVDKDNPGSGHNTIIVGINDLADYAHLATKDALIFDYWTGGVCSTRNAFAAGGPLEDYDESKIMVVLHVKEGEVNPFSEPCPDDSIVIQLERKAASYAKEFMGILQKRKQDGETIKAVTGIMDGLHDWDKVCLAPDDAPDPYDNQRYTNQNDVVARLETYEKAARVIQSSWRFFSPKPSSSAGIARETQPDQDTHWQPG